MGSDIFFKKREAFNSSNIKPLLGESDDCLEDYICMTQRVKVLAQKQRTNLAAG